jgi:hypothetical protein
VRPELLPLEARDVPAGLGILVPAYFDPTSGAAAWAQLTAAARQVPVMAIMNPDNGPGAHADRSYAAAVDQLRAAGGEVIGYVHTNNGRRPLDQVMTEIKDYRRWYHLDGIFIDEVTSAARKQDLAYYRQLDHFVHHLRHSWTVVDNPGDNTAASYVNVADELVLFENGGGYDTYAPPPWQGSFPASRFANLAIDVPSVAAMQADVRLAAARHTGWVYVTDANLPNPYDRLPSYWTDLVAAVAGAGA